MDLTVWSGLAKSLSTAGLANSKNPANRDQLTPNVALTRGETAGIFNPLLESADNFATSPDGTAWAADRNNSGTTISATNWAELNFDAWASNYGGQFQADVNVVPAADPPRDAVLYQIDEDVYLDIRFTEWGHGCGAGGSFAYLRAQPVPAPAASLLVVVAIVGLNIGRRHRIPRKSTNP